MNKLEEKLKNTPDKPGVYLMKDDKDEIIYVGKAKSLVRRVRQYFQSSRGKDRKVRAMMENVNDFEYIIVDTEVEALVLESNLIKKHRPKYNILLRDDKQYPYIKVSIQDRYPKVTKVREVLKDGASYFGPYPSVQAVNDAVQIIRDIYPIRNCNRNLEKGTLNERPCLNYFIDKCIGPCINNDVKDEYDDMIKEILLFLNGRNEILIKSIKEKMKEASKNLEFEEAVIYRDQLESLEHLFEKQKIISANSDLDQDVIAVAKGIEEACVQIFFIRGGKVIGREHFLIKDTFSEEKRDIINSFIKQFYSGTAFIPKEILIEREIKELEIIEELLSEIKGEKVSINVPKIGEKKKLLNMVKKNAEDMINKYGDRFLKKQRKNRQALKEIEDVLMLENKIERIEAYDISNISGVNSVGSMVVFEGGIEKKSDYRRFKIENVQGPDDYASMEEVLFRRFSRGLNEKESLREKKVDLKGFYIFPDLIMIDGGKGQVNVVLRVLYDLGLNIPVCGLVKDEFHNTRGIIYNNKEISLDESSLGFKLIYKIQEEAHRFALSYHKSLRHKDLFRSELDGIKGIGKKRKRNLLKHFNSIEKIKKATLEELQEVNGMNKPASKSLYEHFRRV